MGAVITYRRYPRSLCNTPHRLSAKKARKRNPVRAAIIRHKYEKKLKDKNYQLNRMNFFSHIKITY